jgi:hypothetical protein
MCQCEGANKSIGPQLMGNNVKMWGWKWDWMSPRKRRVHRSARGTRHLQSRPPGEARCWPGGRGNRGAQGRVPDPTILHDPMARPQPDQAPENDRIARDPMGNTKRRRLLLASLWSEALPQGSSCKSPPPRSLSLPHSSVPCEYAARPRAELNVEGQVWCFL